MALSYTETQPETTSSASPGDSRLQTGQNYTPLSVSTGAGISPAFPEGEKIFYSLTPVRIENALDFP